MSANRKGPFMIHDLSRSRSRRRALALPWLLGTIAVAAVWSASACGPDNAAPAAPPDDSSTVVTFGHGAFFAPGGKVLTPSAELFARTQRQYIETLRRQAEAIGGLSIGPTQALIASQVNDDLLANALFIEWLLDQVRPDERANMKAVNAAMRAHYLDKLRPSSLSRRERHDTKGVGSAIAQRLLANGISAFATTTSGGEKYLQECAAAGVPIPPPMFSSAWVNEGIIDDEFISTGEQAELMRYTSDKPAGVCLALPRYFSGSDDIDLLGIICLGTVSNKACFWDNPRPTTFRRNVPIDIREFVGGFDLEANGQGVCSDCHAGENPFIVHPEKKPFLSFSVFGSRWYEPIVHPSWPQNPGPTNLLAGVSSPQRCDSCHAAGRSGGRFPELSTALSGYCNTVLETAALGGSALGTMPPYGQPRAAFASHLGALRTACNARPSTGTIVDGGFVDDNRFLSPPQIIDPLYGCAEQVAVRGAVLDAKVFLYVNGVPVGSLTARNPGQETFTIAPLLVGDVVTAQQESAGTMSAISAPVTVRDHRVDYPAGLPAPAIDPTLIHECAEVIAVRHVPGAQVTVYVNGGVPVTGSTATDWTAFWPGKRPFVIGDEFSAEISLCSDRSPISGNVRAVAEPRIIPGPSFDPPQTFSGQQLVTIGSLTNGSQTKLEVSGLSAGGFTTPISWWPNYDLATALGRPLAFGDSIAAQQTLCRPGPITTTPPVSKCEELPAPRIYRPLAGTTFVVVWQAIPGARIRVYDASSTEIGDGSGDIIVLSRALTSSDVLTVVQQVGECTSRSGYRISTGRQK
jgi:hypothetical protein